MSIGGNFVLLALQAFVASRMKKAAAIHFKFSFRCGSASPNLAYFDPGSKRAEYFNRIGQERTFNIT